MDEYQEIETQQTYHLTWWDKIWTYPWAIGVVLGHKYQEHKAINAEVRENVSWCLDDDVIEDTLWVWNQRN